MSAQPGAPATQKWFGFLSLLQTAHAVDATGLLYLVAEWGDAREAECPDSTRPLAEWLVARLEQMEAEASPEEPAPDAPAPQPV